MKVVVFLRERKLGAGHHVRASVRPPPKPGTLTSVSAIVVSPVDMSIGLPALVQSGQGGGQIFKEHWALKGPEVKQSYAPAGKGGRQTAL